MGLLAAWKKKGDGHSRCTQLHVRHWECAAKNMQRLMGLAPTSDVDTETARTEEDER